MTPPETPLRSAPSRWRCPARTDPTGRKRVVRPAHTVAGGSARNYCCHERPFMPPINPESAKPLRWFGTLVGLSVFGAITIGVTGAFAHFGGWLLPGPLTQERLMAAFETANEAPVDMPLGRAKSACVPDWFESAGKAVKLPRAAKLSAIPPVGGLALASGAADTGLDAAGQTIPVRGPAVAVLRFEPAGPAVRTDEYALFDGVLNLITRHPSPWRLQGPAGATGDPTDDGTLPGPADRTRIDVGPVSFDHDESDRAGLDHAEFDHAQTGGSLPCAAVNPDPTMQLRGIELDPTPSAQSSAFERSFTLRPQVREAKPPTVA
jgi:hypothetical protein